MTGWFSYTISKFFSCSITYQKLLFYAGIPLTSTIVQTPFSIFSGPGSKEDKAPNDSTTGGKLFY